MIEHTTIKGRPATVAYLNDAFELVDDQASATLVKIIFTDDQGGAIFATPAEVPKGEGKP